MSEQSSAGLWARGGTIFGGTMMVVIGVFQVLTGIAAIAKKNFFVVTDNYAYNMNVTAWGWIHLLVGALVLIVGACILAGQTWARAMGIGLAVVSAVSNFFFIPYYPLWSLVVIALAVFVVWALAKDLSLSDGMDTGTGATATGGNERWQSANATGRSSTSGNGVKAPAHRAE